MFSVDDCKLQLTCGLLDNEGVKIISKTNLTFRKKNVDIFCFKKVNLKTIFSAKLNFFPQYCNLKLSHRKKEEKYAYVFQIESCRICFSSDLTVFRLICIRRQFVNAFLSPTNLFLSFFLSFFLPLSFCVLISSFLFVRMRLNKHMF